MLLLSATNRQQLLGENHPRNGNMTESVNGSDNSQMQQVPTTWHPDEHPEYDIQLQLASDALLSELRKASSTERRTMVLDPREMHTRLYHTLTPYGYPEYAGTYRGTKGTSLEHRNVNLVSHTGRAPQELQVSGKVISNMEDFYKRWVDEYFDKSKSLSLTEAMHHIVKIFYALGLIHPFLDGNGHIQRLVFAACTFEDVGISLSPRWTIHPRPYALDLAEALEGRSISESLPLLPAVFAKYLN